jgi:hypothetical protein
MRKWAISDFHRQIMIDDIFKSGYGGEGEKDMIRWTKEEMSELCEDKDLLCLFQRYVTWYPATRADGDQRTMREKIAFEREVEAQIALDELLI